MQNISEYIINKPDKEAEINPIVIDDYSIVLNKYTKEYNIVDYHLQVGQINNNTKGWVIHISVIRTQILELLDTVLPILLHEKIPFKLIRNREVAKLLLDGNLGYEQIGKIISIYPEDNIIAVNVAKRLIILTQGFIGPDIPTDFNLGGVIYTCYKPGPYKIPFALPIDISWPFAEISSPITSEPNKLFKNKYKPIAILKPDAKGRVIKGIYMNGLFSVKTCLIKEGRKHMWADDEARDIKSRLVWQKQLHKDLKGIIQVPEILDLFEENGNTYLVMEFIKGEPLDIIISDVYAGSNWLQVPVPKKTFLMNYLFRIIAIIEKLHLHGYVHRDITPVNFIVNEKDEIYLIDMELAYSYVLEKPLPPFKLGTHGFMSPEQQAIKTPTIKEDIYGLGALMILFFTGLSPVKFGKESNFNLHDSIYFFTGSHLLADIINACLNENPGERPSISMIKNHLEKYRTEIQSFTLAKKKGIYYGQDSLQLRILIEDALRGLTKPCMMTDEVLWSSLSVQRDIWIGNEQLERTYLSGLYSGMAGVMYTLGQAKKISLDIDCCLQGYKNSWQFIQANCLNKLSETPGLYEGAAGLALGIQSGIESNLLESTDQHIYFLHKCFECLAPGLNLAEGVSGQGMALLNCNKLIDPSLLENKLTSYVDIIMDKQLKDGSWAIYPKNGNKNNKITGLSFGIAGITCFLIEYAHYNRNHHVLHSIQNALNWFIRQSRKKDAIYSWTITTKSKTTDMWSCTEGLPGIILCFIRAFDLLQEPMYHKIAESALSGLPTYPVKINFTQAFGLAGLGEIYLEAFSAFKDERWLQSASWLTGLFTHSCLRFQDGAAYWSLDAGNNPVADFMLGNSGIIHFLMRSLMPEKISYPFLRNYNKQ